MDETVFPIQWEDPSDADLSWEWDDMHHPTPLAPLAGDYVRHGLASGFNYRYERLHLPMHVYCRVINGYVYFAAEFGEPDKDRVREQAREKRRGQARVVRSYWNDKVLPTSLQTYQWMRAAPIETAALITVAELWDDAWNRIRHLWGLHFMTNSGSYQALDDLADFYESIVPGANASDACMLIQSGAADLQQLEQDLYELAECARGFPEVAQAIRNDPYQALAMLPHLKHGTEFDSVFRAFLSKHGHLGQAFDDLELPSWEDDPALVLIEIRKRLDHRHDDPAIRRRRLESDANALADQMRRRLGDQPEALQRFEAALALARDVGPLTENHNYWLDRMLHAHAHRFAVRVGIRLEAAGVLADAKDVFFLHVDEIRELLRAPQERHGMIAARKSARDQQSKMRPPRYLGRPPESTAPVSRFDVPRPAQRDAQVLRGVGACAGQAQGAARVIQSQADLAAVQPGDVLVCPSSNPSWVPLFGIIAGLVTNTGGVTSHAAVVAREFGIPAVVGTGDATQRIRSGQQVVVDGTAGEVRLL